MWQRYALKKYENAEKSTLVWESFVLIKWLTICNKHETLQKLLSKDDYLTNLSVLWKILHTRWTVSFQNRRHFIFISLYFKNVTVIMDMTAWTTVVDTVWMVPSVTNWLVTVIEDVTQAIPTATVTEVGEIMLYCVSFSIFQ